MMAVKIYEDDLSEGVRSTSPLRNGTWFKAVAGVVLYLSVVTGAVRNTVSSCSDGLS